MLTMDIAHPDIEEFITVKQDLKKVTGANISIRLSDEFMQAVEKDEDYTLRWPIDSKTPKYTKVVKAKDLWNLVIKSAHNTAEPGLIFLGPPALLFHFFHVPGLQKFFNKSLF